MKSFTEATGNKLHVVMMWSKKFQYKNIFLNKCVIRFHFITIDIIAYHYLVNVSYHYYFFTY